MTSVLFGGIARLILKVASAHYGQASAHYGQTGSVTASLTAAALFYFNEKIKIAQF